MESKTRYVTVRVPVPESRLAEFYGVLGHFFDGSTAEGPASVPVEDGEYKKWTGPEDQEAAITYWRKYLNKRGKKMFLELAHHPGQRFTGHQIAELLGLDAPNQVAGVLAWPGRYAHKMGYQLPTEWDAGSEESPGGYWMRPEVAELFISATELIASGDVHRTTAKGCAEPSNRF